MVIAGLHSLKVFMNQASVASGFLTCGVHRESDQLHVEPFQLPAPPRCRAPASIRAADYLACVSFRLNDKCIAPSLRISLTNWYNQKPFIGLIGAG
jgi:hypothetical protein